MYNNVVLLGYWIMMFTMEFVDVERLRFWMFVPLYVHSLPLWSLSNEMNKYGHILNVNISIGYIFRVWYVCGSHLVPFWIVMFEKAYYNRWDYIPLSHFTSSYIVNDQKLRSDICWEIDECILKRYYAITVVISCLPDLLIEKDGGLLRWY